MRSMPSRPGGPRPHPSPSRRFAGGSTRRRGRKAEPFKSPGMGFDIRLTGAHMVGAGLVVEDRPVHVELFALGEAGTG